ncbi:hypothetical protein ACGF0D_36380 [Kitasatospora sp. NPDC048298]|uniref:hypothetical protein n=1 Tax=Kitasatospora sp. NPDC048298 TaxID=3364049 RepID=UPI003711C2F3
MLSDKSRPVIAVTLPVVAEHIGEIAKRFYTHMFGEHPELLDGVFNRGNPGSRPPAAGTGRLGGLVRHDAGGDSGCGCPTGSSSRASTA